MNVPIAQIKERSYKVAEEPEIAIIKFDKNEWVLMSVNFQIKYSILKNWNGDYGRSVKLNGSDN